MLNTTRLALNLSRYANGVAKKHAEVSRAMFPGYAIDAITNGVHAATWACPSMAALFDRHAPGWRRDNNDLRRIMAAPADEIWAAHQQAKEAAIEAAVDQGGPMMRPDVFTIGFARRNCVQAFAISSRTLPDSGPSRKVRRSPGHLCRQAHRTMRPASGFIEIHTATARSSDVTLPLPNFDIWTSPRGSARCSSGSTRGPL